MYLLGICDNPDVLNVMLVVNTVILGFKIVVPLVLILSLSLKFAGAVKSGDEDLLKKAQQSAIKNAIAVVLIFFVPMFVETVVLIGSGNSEHTSCITDISRDSVDTLYVAKAEKILGIAESEQSYSSLGQAKMEISKIKNDETKSSMLVRADAVEKAIKEKTETKDSQTVGGGGNPGTGGGGNGTTPPKVGEGNFVWPCNNCSGLITSRFGPRKSPCAGCSSQHNGLDIGIGTGTPVLAIASGTVTTAAYGHQYNGNYIFIDHGNGYVSQYLHNSTLKVSAGQSVSQGQTIALSGSSGVGTGPHLHLGLKYNGSYVNPESYLP